MKKIKFLILSLAILLFAGKSAFALQCAPSRNSQGSADQCYSYVTVASNETTLVSAGTVLVYDITNAQNAVAQGAYQARVSTASTNGVFVAGVAQNIIATGNSALVLVRGRGVVGVKTTETITSGNALFVSTSGDASTVTSTTQTQLGFALTTLAASGNGETTTDAYITVV